MGKSTRTDQERIIFIALMILLFLIYIWVYLVSPFGGQTNDLVLNLIYLVFSLYPAILLWRILAFYDPQDAPRGIWFRLFLGFGLFFVGDLAWTVLNMVVGEVASPSLADLFYVPAYLFLVAGLLRQHHLLFPSGIVRISMSNLILWAVSTGLAVAVVFLRFGAFDPGGFIEYLYPVLDLSLALVAFVLVRTFQQGALARPLWGFLVLFFADLIYALLVQSGQYDFVLNQADFGRLVSDVVYNLAYIVFALGFWGHYAMLKFGSEQVTDQA